MKEVNIKLDDKSVEILNKVDALHRESLINYGIRLLAESQNFKVLTGEADSKEIASLSSLGNEPINETPTKAEPEPEEKPKKKPAIAIDW